MSQAAPEVSPALFYETVTAFQRTAAIKSAVELDLFTVIGRSSRTAAEIAADCRASEKGVRILCDYLTVAGFLLKNGGHYSLTADSAAFLDRNSPAYLGGSIEFLLSPLQREGHDKLTEAVRKGGTAIPEEAVLAPDHPIWVRFAKGMAPLMRMPAEALARAAGVDMGKKMRILDIAAGHGMFGIACARANRNVEVTAVDWPSVLEVARENASEAGVADRYKTIAGSAFEVDFGTGYDLVLLTNFLHHFDTGTCRTLLEKVHGALAANGKTAILEFIPNEDRISPPDPAMFSLTMLTMTPSGDAYTFREIETMLTAAGFRDCQLHQIPPIEQAVIAVK